MNIIYLYGFASGPNSEKAQFFKKKFSSIASVGFQIYDYIPTPHEFSNMKLSEIQTDLHKYLKTHSSNQKVILFGSSFGGLIVTWYAQLHPEKVDRLILIAPALQFTPEFITQTLVTSMEKWKIDGVTFVDHYRFGGRISLKYSFLKDLIENPIPTFSKHEFPVPTIIFHGENDEVVPSTWSISFAESNPNIKSYLLNGDHQLLDQKSRIWNEIKLELKLL